MSSRNFHSAAVSEELQWLSTSPKHPPVLPGQLYSLTLRKADDVDLGLQMCETHNGASLLICHVRAHAAVDVYNKLCAGTREEVRPGDLIIKVNKVESNAARMLEECSKQLCVCVSLTLMRGDPSLCLLASTLSLPPEAPEFVPGAPAWIGHGAPAWIGHDCKNIFTVCPSTKAIQARVTAVLCSQMVNKVCTMPL